MNHRSIYGSMMVRMGDADALVPGITKNYPDTLRPALQVIGVREGIHKVSGIYLFITRKGSLYFLADPTVNIEPTAEDLAEIALCAAQEARRFDVEPRVAMLSFSNFGSTRHPLCDKVRRAVEFCQAWRSPLPAAAWRRSRGCGEHHDHRRAGRAGVGGAGEVSSPSDRRRGAVRTRGLQADRHRVAKLID
jgi:hypothetical protein